jgi:hypothetical protein
MFMAEIRLYLKKERIGMECGEVYRHDNGLSHSERKVMVIKELIRFAMISLGFYLGFTRKNVFQLMGELD